MKRLVRAQQHPAVNNLVDYITNSKPFSIGEVDHYHHEILRLVNEATDQAYTVAHLAKGNAKLFEYYNAIYQKLNVVSSSLEQTKPNSLT
jgi:hypothetical protein